MPAYLIIKTTRETDGTVTAQYAFAADEAVTPEEIGVLFDEAGDLGHNNQLVAQYAFGNAKFKLTDCQWLLKDIYRSAVPDGKRKKGSDDGRN